MKKKKVVILGAGFGGVEVARTLASRASFLAEIILVSQKPYFEYYPGLYRVLSSEPPFEVFVPITSLIPKTVRFFVDEIITIDTQDRRIILKEGIIDNYDILVLALGSEAFYFNIPGVETYSLGCKSLVDVRYLRRDLISKINRVHDENKELHVVIAGGGPTGVEMSGQLHAMFKDESRFHDIPCSKLQVTLVQADSRLVPQLSENISELIKKHLEKIDVKVLTNTKILEQKEDGIVTSTGAIETDTLIWTAGTQTNKIIQHMQGLTFSSRKKVLVDEFLKAQGMNDTYVIGDLADTKYSGLAQTALSHGAYVGKSIAKELKGKKLNSYKPSHTPIHVMPVGRFWGIAHWNGYTITGLIPHMMRYAVDVFYFFKRLHFFNFMKLYIKGRLE